MSVKNVKTTENPGKNWAIYAATVIMLCLTLLLAPNPTIAQIANKSQVMAVYLYNFLRFVEWPQKLDQLKGENINICTIGDDPFDKKVIKVLQKKKIGDKKINVSRNIKISDINNCVILFISESKKKNLNIILKETAQKPILTASEIDGFYQKGGMIGFALVDGTVKLEINTNNTKESKLKLKASLLDVAHKVEK